MRAVVSGPPTCDWLFIHHPEGDTTAININPASKHKLTLMDLRHPQQVFLHSAPHCQCESIDETSNKGPVLP